MRDNNSSELVNHSQTSKFSSTSISDGLQKVSSFLINMLKDIIVSFPMKHHNPTSIFLSMRKFAFPFYFFTLLLFSQFALAQTPCVAPNNATPSSNWGIVQKFQSNAVVWNGGTPTAADLNGDGISEILIPASDYSGYYVYEGDGSDATTATKKYVIPLTSEKASQPAIADLNGDGTPEVIINSAGNLYIFDNESGSTTNYLYKSTSTTQYLQEVNPYVVDINEDGIPEIALGNDIFIISGTFGATGSTLIKKVAGPVLNYLSNNVNFASYQRELIIVDIIASNPGKEIVFGSRVYGVNLSTGVTTLLKDMSAIAGFSSFSEDYGPTAVADMDLDGDLDIAYNGKTKVLIWDPNQMQVLFNRTPPSFNMIVRGMPLVANVYNDVTNAGKTADFPELIIVNSATATTGILTAYNLNFNSGNQYVWSISTNDKSGSTGVTAFDFDGNGIREIIYRDETTLRIINGNSNTPSNYATFASTSATWSEYPIVADLDNDNEAEIAVTGGGRLQVFERDPAATPWKPAPNYWNQRNYRITNINSNLTVPATELSPTSTKAYNNNLAQLQLRDLGNNVPSGSVIAADASIVINSVTGNCPTISINTTISNNGSYLLEKQTAVALYNGNPTNSNATLLGVYFTPADIAAGGTLSFTLELSIPSSSLNLYAVVNDKGNTNRPYNFSSFPNSNQLECNYSNNISQGLAYSCADTDVDGVADYVDLDDDNDGVLDKIECNPSAKKILFAGSSEDFSTMRSSLYNEFNNNKAAGAIIIQSNIIQTATVPAGFYDGYDIVVFGGAAFETIHANHWAALQTAIQNKTSKAFIIESDNCCVAANQNGLVNLLNRVFGTSYTLSSTNPATNQTFTLNSTNSYASVFTTNSLSGNNYYPILNVAASDILFYSPSVAGSALAGMKQLPGTTDRNRFVAWFVDGTITQGAPWYTTNQNKIAPAFYDAYSATTPLDCDTDNDGVYNHLDLDSDGDGCTDAKEAGVTGTLNSGLVKNGSNGAVTSTNTLPNAIAAGPFGANGLANSLETTSESGVLNYNNTYSVYALSRIISVCADTDSDGVSDINDIDDDNDGVLDSEEGYRCGILTNNSQLFSDPVLKQFNLVTNGGFDQGNTKFTTSYSNGSLGGCGQYTVAPTGWASSTGSLSEGNALQINAECGGAFYPFWNQTITVKPNTNYKLGYSIRHANFARVSFRVNGGAAQGNHGTTSSWVTHENIINSGDRTSMTISLFEATGAPSSADFAVDDIFLIEVKDGFCSDPLDTDNDGIYNHLDPDSDNDGCSDALESGTTTSTTANFAFTGTMGANGLDNSLEIGADTGVINYNSSYFYSTSRNYAACIDTDGDSVNDLIDIDDDNDGIVDAVESPSCFYSASEASTPQTVTTELAIYNNNLISRAIDNDPATFSAFSASVNWVGKELFRLKPSVVGPLLISGVQMDLISWPLSSAPTNTFKLQGSNDDGGSWSDLSAAVSSNATTGSFTISNTLNPTVKYNLYRLVGVAGTSNYGGVKEVRFALPANFQASIYPKLNCSSDTDADGTPNHLDLDSDEDSCSDALEGGATSQTTANYQFSGNAGTNGLDNSIETAADTGEINYILTYGTYANAKSLAICLDSDNDLVNDIVDIDDDNDGVQDGLEYSCNMSLMTKTGITVSSTVGWTYNGAVTLANLVDNSESVFAYPNANSTGEFLNQTVLQFDLPAPKSLSLIEITAQADKTPLGSGQYSIQGWNGFAWETLAANQTFATSVPKSGSTNSYKFNLSFNYYTYSKYRILGTSARGSVTGWIQEAYFTERSCTDTDTDGDGIPNRLDLDSDGDGCTDAKESFVSGTLTTGDVTNRINGSNTTTSGVTNAIVVGDYGANGFADSLETVVDNGVYSSGVDFSNARNASIKACTDTDGDSIIDLVDLDDDNDGVLDSQECPPFDINKLSYAANSFTVSNGASTQQTFPAAPDGLVVNIWSLDNSFNVRINGSHIVNPEELEFYTPNYQNSVVEFLDGTSYGAVWDIAGSKASPLARLYIDKNGVVKLYGKRTSSGILEEMRLRNGFFNTVNLNTNSTNTFQIGQVVIGQTFVSGDYGVIIPPTCDDDNDGIPNGQDLDSDGDGCPDAKEAGINGILLSGDVRNGSNGAVTSTTNLPNAIAGSAGNYGANGLANVVETATESGIVSYTSTYSSFARSSTLSVCLDSDGDDVPDVLDIDDDNDGILDSIEQEGCFGTGINLRPLTFSGTAVIAKTTNTITSSNTNSWISSYSNESFSLPLSFQFKRPTIGNTAMIGLLPAYGTQAPASYTNEDYKFYFNSTNVQVPFGTTYNVTQTATAQDEYSIDISATGYVTMKINGVQKAAFQGVNSAYKISVAGLTTTVFRDVRLSNSSNSLVTTCTDTDNDGVPNYLDLDSDGDGCPDAKEANVFGTLEAGSVVNRVNSVVTTTPNVANAIAEGDYGLNGYADAIETATESGVYSGYYAYEFATAQSVNVCLDTDGDQIADVIDIDDDNDGILDAIESPSCFFSALELEKPIAISTELAPYSTYVIENAIDASSTTASAFDPSVNWVNKEIYKLTAQRPIPIAGIKFDLVSWAISNGGGNTFKLQGSNNNTTWIDLSGASSSTSNAGSYQLSNSISPTTKFKFYRVIGVAGSSYYGGVNDIQFVLHTSFSESQYPKLTCTQTAVDADTIPNHLDLDSDGDGCSDALEAGTTTTTTTNFKFIGTDFGANGFKDGLEKTAPESNLYGANYTTEYAYNASIKVCVDTDGDDVADIIDLDDDNDGILDAVESPTCFYTMAQLANPLSVSSELAPYSTYVISNAIDANAATLSAFDPNVNWVGKELFKFTAKNYIAITGMSFDLVNWPISNGAGNTFKLQGSGDNFYWTDLSIVSSSTNTTGTYTIANTLAPNTKFKYFRIIGVAGSSWYGGVYEARFNFGANTVPSANPLTVCTENQDNDALPNHQDIDSDGDNCPDAVEAGVTLFAGSNVAVGDRLTTTVIAGPYGANGFADGLETLAESGIYSSTYKYLNAINNSINACLDSDTDGVSDVFDLDDDNDGVLDLDEVICTVVTTSKTGLVISKPSTINFTFNGSATINKLIDGIDNNNYVLYGPTGTLNDEWFRFQFPTPKIINYLEIGHYLGQTLFTTSTTYRVEGSNNGTAWENVSGTLTYNNNLVSSSGGLSSFNSNVANFNNNTAYLYYRLVGINAVSGGTWATEIYFKDKLCTYDTDNDGTPNTLDLDSDGDGCSDAFESGTTTSKTANFRHSAPHGTNGFANSLEATADNGIYNGVYTYSNAIDNAINMCADTDNDGVSDVIDLDDDNDGVLDVTEYNCEVTTMSKTGITVSSTVSWGYNGTTLNNLVDGAENLVVYPNGEFLNETIFQFNLPSAKVLEQIEVSTQSGLTTLGTTGTYNLEGWNGTSWVVIEKNKSFGGTSAPIRAPGNTYKFYMPNNLTAYSKYRIFGTSAKGTYNSSSWIQEAYFFERACNTDIDNDGIPNWRDSDSDGDSCPDAVEVGTTAIGTSGVASNVRLSASTIPAPYSSNGFATGLETTAGNGVYKGIYTYNMAVDASVNACTDTDGDGIANAIDLDDDNDGVLDATELNCVISIVAKTGITVSSTVTWGYTSSTLANLVNGKEDLTAYSTTDFIDQTILQFDFPAAKALSLIEISTQNSGTTLGTTGKYNVQGWNGSKWINILTNQTFSITAPVLAPANSYTIKMPFNTTAYTKYRLWGTSTKGTVSTTTWLQEAYFTEQSCNLDTDGDGTPNTLDTDSDGDGCSDAVEAGTVTGTSATIVTGTYDANGFANSLETATESGIYSGTYSYQFASDATFSSCRDTDNDGVTDVNDIDDDNDGILDSIECPATELISNGNFANGTTGWTVGTGWTLIDGTMANFGDGSNNVKLSQTIGRPYPTTRPGYVDFKVDVKATGYNNIPSNGYNASITLQVNGTKYAVLTNPDNNTTTASIQTFNGALSNLSSFPVQLASGPFTTVTISIPSNVFFANNSMEVGFSANYDDFYIDNVSVSSSPNLAACDTDRDGVPNSRDLDSDGDGCFDAVEAKTTYQAGSGIASSDKLTSSTLTGAISANGFIDGLETGTESGLYSGTYLYSRATDPTIKSCIDSDFDGVPDIDDLDDDNDGLLDFDEYTCTYTAQNTSGTWKGNTPSTVTATFTGAQVQAPAYSVSDAKYTYAVPANQGRAKFGVANFTLAFDPAIPSTELALYVGDVDAILNANDPTFQIKVNGVNDNGTFIASTLTSAFPSLAYNSSTGLANLSPRRNDAELLLKGNSATMISSVQIITSNVHANDLVAYNYFARSCSDADTDADGIPNRLDLDSDGDGCSDANEAYATTTAQGTDGNQTYGTNPITVDATGKITTAAYPAPNANYSSVGSASTITTQPTDQSVNVGGTAVFSTAITAGSGTTSYQWQVSVDGGTTWTNVTNSAPYSGATTTTLTVTTVPLTMKGYRYRLNVAQSNYVCGNITSSVVRLLMDNTPIVVDDSATGAEDLPISGNVLTNDKGSGNPAVGITVTSFTIGSTTYPAGQTATIAGVGSIIMNTNGTYTFTPAANYNGSVPLIEYTATDANGGTDVGALNLTVTPVNDPPVAVSETTATPQDTPKTGTLFPNYSDVDGDTLSITTFAISGVTYNAGDTATIPGKGTIVVNDDGTYTFTPAFGYVGTVPVITYAISDGQGGTTTTTLTLSVTDVNDAPLATDDIVVSTQGTTINGSSILGNDTDIELGTLSVTGFTVPGLTGTQGVGTPTLIPGKGTITINANGTYTFVPATGFSGPVPLIAYTISDGNGGTDIANLDIFISVVNTAPVATDNTKTVAEDTTAIGNVLTDGTADSDNENDFLTVSEFTIEGVTYPAGSKVVIPNVGTMQVNVNGSYEFIPNTNWSGLVPTVSYQVSDGNGGTAIGDLEISVTASNDNPIAVNDDNKTTPEDTPVTVNVLTNDSDPDGNTTLTVTQFSIAGITYPVGQNITIAGKGTITALSNGDFTFTPLANFNGPLPTILYTVSDGTLTNSANFNLTVTPVNDVPVVVSETPTTAENTPLSGALLSNDTDVETATASLTVTQFTISGTTYPAGSIVDIPSVGTVIVNSDGTYTFSPNRGYFGTPPVITYAVSDGNGGTTNGTLAITVTPVNDPPVVVNESVQIQEDVVATGNVLTNDSDPEQANSALSISQFTIAGISGTFTSSATIPNVGTIAISANGAYTFTPVANYNGLVPMIEYTVSDGLGGTTNGNLTIVVAAVNDAPVVTNDTKSAPVNTPIVDNVLTNDRDIEASTLSLTKFTIGGVDFPAGTTATLSGVGTIIMNADGTFTFTPATNYVGSASVITYTVFDGTATTTGTLSLTITPIDADGDGIPDATEKGTGSTPLDSDGDGTPDWLDTDSDNDGIPDSLEDAVCIGVLPCTPSDTDGDGIPDYRDVDSDGDGIADATEDSGCTGTAPCTPTDTDGDGTPNYLDLDSDGDGITDAIEKGSTSTPLDSDSDGTPDYLDTDSDGDGILDRTEGTIDTDGDGIPNYRDTDSDGDGITDAIEGTTDTDGDGSPNYIDTDSDDDGITDAIEKGPNATPVDTDGDGTPDYKDLDSDNDGIPDNVEGATDADGDGTPNYLDLDSDGDGIPDSIEKGTNGSTPLDTDGDGTPNYLDIDSDDDGIPDSVEGRTDTDGDGIPNYLDTDSDGDGILDSIEDAGCSGTAPCTPTDTDGDGTPNYMDLDSDGDGIPDSIEKGPTGTPVDTDNDGSPDYLDLDSDGDGITDAVEKGTGTTPLDTDGDGTPDFRDLDSDGDSITDANEGTTDTDGDGTPNYRDLDSDGDGKSDATEGNIDTDLDGTPNYLDLDSDDDGVLDAMDQCPLVAGLANLNGCPLDSDGDGLVDTVDSDDDNDGILDTVEAAACSPSDLDCDTDGDGIPNRLDLESDGDGIKDITEANGTDADNDGIADGTPDSNGVPASANGGVTPPNTDGTGNSNPYDLDSDGDGISDAIEKGNGSTLADTDNDNIPDYLDLDSDGDGITDAVEGSIDTDGDSIPNFRDLDSDGDGIPDATEGVTDTDGDGIPNYKDLDSDGDGITDAIEDAGCMGIVPCTPTNSDNDNIPDYLDADSDNDGIPDTIEKGPTGTPVDTDSDGTPDYIDTDTDGDGILDSVEDAGCTGTAPCTPTDTDGDGIPNFRDLDSDGDGISDAIEGTTDTDGDSKPNYLDSDSDGDGISDLIEGNVDTDGDGTPNYLDLDSDGDGIPDSIEKGTATSPADTDGDGTPDYLDTDTDGDGIPDSVEDYGCTGTAPCTTTDTDGDGIPNYKDLDSDGDGIPDSVEKGANGATPDDTDGATLPDYLDTDSDNDGILDAVERGLDGNNPLDTDGDGIPDYKEIDSDNDGIPDAVEGIVDTDGDGTPDYRDTDSDNDGILDATEDAGCTGTAPCTPSDTDGDGIPNYKDLDSDADNKSDQSEGESDFDGDTIPNYLDPDSDGDGINDIVDQCPLLVGIQGNNGCPIDTDADGIYDINDFDDDNDGILDTVEAVACSPSVPDCDTDGDGIPNRLDPDSDNDGISDVRESNGTDVDGDGKVDGAVDADGVPSSTNGGLTPPNTDGTTLTDPYDTDSDGDGISDALEKGPNGNTPVDTDSDGTPDYRDTDSDNDGIPDNVERGSGAAILDTDGDGTPDFRDTDSDNDGIIDAIEKGPSGATPLDTDSDGIPNYRDLDSDGDGLTDTTEGTTDTDGDSLPNYIDVDSDGDGISDLIEKGVNPASPLDTDGDGIPNYKDLDSDGDGIPDAVEGTTDTDGDGIPNYLDLDSDGDGIADSIEDDGCTGTAPCTPTDTDGDGIPNYLDLDSDGDGKTDAVEKGPGVTPMDSDGDGIPDYRDVDNLGKPDVNVTNKYVPVNGNVKTNDPVSSGTTYGQPTQLTGATLAMNSDGTYTFTSAVPGTYVYYVSVCGPNQTSGCPQTPLEITVLDPILSDAPVANDDHITIEQGTVTTVNVLANDKAGDLSKALVPSSLSIITAPAHGTVVINSDGTIQYTPSPYFVGKDSLVYSICDNQSPALCRTATLYFTVEAAGIPAVTTAVDDYNIVASGTAATGSVLTNDSSTTGAASTVSLVTGPTSAQGTFTMAANGTYTFTPVAGFSGPVAIVYEACTSANVCSKATLHILVDPAPTIVNDTANGNVNVPVTGNLATNDVVPTGTTYGQPAALSGATISVGPNGAYTFTATVAGTYTYTVPVCAPGQTVNCPTQTLVIIVTSLNSAPVAVADTKQLADNLPATGNVLSNDTDSDNNTLSVTKFAIGSVEYTAGSTVTIPSVGTIRINSDGSYIFTPLPNYQGNVPTIVVTITDGSATATAPLSIEVLYDSDNDGILDAVEKGNGSTPVDTDNDGTPDYLDLDSDNDGIPDTVEKGPNGATPLDTDGDGTPDYRDLDSDNDGIPDSVEKGPNGATPVDTDGDGTPDYRDLDSDNDGIPDSVEKGPNGATPVDTDGDGTPDYRDLDSDNDGIPDSVEKGPNGATPLDTDGDGIPDYRDLPNVVTNPDSDGDGVTDSQEVIDGTNPNDPCSSNPSSITLPLSRSFLEGDCDSDGLTNEQELGTNPKLPTDVDNNGVPDYLEFNNHSASEDGLEVFNSMTNNGDNLNDAFIIRGIEEYPDNTLIIYNRWGVEVYNVDGYGQDDKYFRGLSEGRKTISQSAELPKGTYYYLLRYVNKQGIQKQRTGYLYITK